MWYRLARGGHDLDRYFPIQRRLREAVGPDFRLMHEAVGTQGGTLESIISDFAPVEDLGFYWFEEAFGGGVSLLRWSLTPANYPS